MSGPALLLHQFRFDQKAFWREPASVFFTVALPVIFLVILSAVFGNERVEDLGVQVSTYYVPGLLTLAVVSATATNLAITLAIARERGVLKRMRGTPMPVWAFVGAKVCSSLVVAAMLVVVLVGIGAIGYGVEVPGRTAPAALLALAVGAGSFCCLGFALATLIPSESAAPAVTNAIVLPLYFVSGVFFSVEDAPAWLTDLAAVFPIRHLFEALFTPFDPATAGAGIEWSELAILALWGVGGLVLALRRFAWEPRGGR